MTTKSAQAELLRLLNVGTTRSSGVNSLAGSLGISSGQASLLSSLIPAGLGGVASAGSLLGGVVKGLTGGGMGGVLGGLLGVSPITAAIGALVGGGGQTAKPTFTKYAAPDPINLSFGVSNGGQNLAVASTGQNGTSRTASNITVNVSTMDSQSFSDNSAQITQAVRQAMLNSGALTDVITDL